MKKLTVEESLLFAEQNFPYGPERLAEALNVEVRLGVCKGDGYCLRYQNRTLIRLNNEVPAKRRRFTLAHELGHLLLGISSTIGEMADEAPFNLSQEEKQVNEIAGQILLPVNVAKNAIRRLPISRKVVEKLAEQANVSLLFVVRRLTALSSSLGLVGAATLHYENEQLKWSYESQVNDLSRFAPKLLALCLEQENHILKIVRSEQEDVLCAVLLPNPALSSQTLFAQILRQNDDVAESVESTVAALEAQLLLGHESLKHSLEGCMSSMKGRIAQLSTEEALALFAERYLKPPTRWPEEVCTRFRIADGQHYLQLRLEIWTLQSK